MKKVPVVTVVGVVVIVLTVLTVGVDAVVCDSVVNVVGVIVPSVVHTCNYAVLIKRRSTFDNLRSSCCRQSK